MNILLVSPIEVTPPNSGGARRILDMGKALATLGHKVTILNITIASGFQNKRPQMLVSENNFEVITTGLFRKIVLKHLIHSDIVQFEFPYLFFLMILLKMLGKNYVLDAHDVEFYLSRNTQQIAAAVRIQKKSPFVFLNRLFQQTPLIVLLIEGISIKLSSMVFTCSQMDAKKLSQLYKTPRKKIAVIPNCGRALSYQKVKKFSFNRPAIVFVGTFDTLPNIYGAKMLVDKIMPIVSKEIPDSLFVIIGSNPPKWLLDAGAASNGSLIVAGEVDDVRPFIAGASVAVAPIYQGSGTRLKLVEYMHLGKPIVSTTKGAEGIDVENEVNILLRDDPSDFAWAIVKLIKDTKVASKISRNCRELALKKYSWETNAKLVNAIYNNLVQT